MYCAVLCSPVAVVEADLFNDNVAEEVPDSGEEGGQLVATLVPPPDSQRVDDHVESRTNHKDV